ncbi:LuxR C-terminal-related transcriptional regulator [Coxiella endosymbiont of Ornithodoros maritimus]|uniref:LuxR C-terminal-related transcriptional regulator n=1 Tax=Coxiella endosymbiont of Ornithodoros maritimus TaxID=1656172 RepID=UPI0038994D3B
MNQKALTKREYDILHFMKLDFTVCEVSKLLAITEGSIKNLIDRLKEKFNCRTRAQLFALEIVKKLS